MYHSKSSVLAGTVAFATVWAASQASADWTEFSLPNLFDAYSATALANLTDGRYVFANQGTYYRQDTFGTAGYTAYSHVAPGNNADPSFIAVWDAAHAVAGGGGFGASDLYRFDPSSLEAPTFVTQSVSLQNYSGVFLDAHSLYVGGANSVGPTHGISYVDLNSATTKVIIDKISTYSCGFARDAAGNLYVGDNDDGKVYKFTAVQLSLAISDSALAITDGTFIHQFGNGLGTLAVDGEGRIWSAGYLRNGLQVYDPVSDTESTVVPGLTNANYKVTTFSMGGQDYVAYLNQADPSRGGTAQYYGFQAIPEPRAFALALAGITVLAMCRRKQHR